MNTLITLGNEFLYENLLSFVGYDDFKALQQLSSEWYELLDHPFFREVGETKAKTDGMVSDHFRNGLVRVYDQKGGYYTYNGDKIHGPCKVTHSDNSYYTSYYINCRMEGAVRYYTPERILRSICEQVGPYTIYYKDGSIEEKGTGSSFGGDIHKNGPYKRFNPAGALIETGIYHDRCRFGPVIKYNTDGLIYEIDNYSPEKGLLHSIHYSPDGSIVGKTVGKSNKVYNEDGLLIREDNVEYKYDGSKIIERNDYDDYKRVIQQVSYNNRGEVKNVLKYGYASHGHHSLDGERGREPNHTTYTMTNGSGDVLETGIYDGTYKPLPTDAPDIHTLTVPELRTLCKERGIKGYAKLRRDELIELSVFKDKEEVRIRSLKVPELRAVCKERGIKGYSKLKRDELIAKLI